MARGYCRRLSKRLKPYGDCKSSARNELERLMEENRRLNDELACCLGARHPQNGRRVLCQGVGVRYAFIQGERVNYQVRTLCRAMKANRAGFYAWLREPASACVKEDQRLLGRIRHAWLGERSRSGCRIVPRRLRVRAREAAADFICGPMPPRRAIRPAHGKATSLRPPCSGRVNIVTEFAVLAGSVEKWTTSRRPGGFISCMCRFIWLSSARHHE